jgi:ribonuclease Z
LKLNHRKNICKELGFVKIFNVPVIHCKHAFGLILEHSQKWKIVFSGDTRPSDELIEAGKGNNN